MSTRISTALENKAKKRNEELVNNSFVAPETLIEKTTDFTECDKWLEKKEGQMTRLFFLALFSSNSVFVF